MFINQFVVFTFLIVGLGQNLIFASEPKLQMLNVVFRHGDRTPVFETIYPNDPYKDEKFYPEGYGVLTQKGKVRAYKLGKILREKYEEFLYYINSPMNIHARSTDYSRTLQTLEYVLEGISELNNLNKLDTSFNLKNISIVTRPKSEDELTLRLYACKTFDEMYQNVLKFPEVMQKIKTFENLTKIIENNTGLNITDFLNLYALYIHFQSQEEMGLEPPSWTNEIYQSKKLLKAAVTELKFLSYNNKMKKRNGGPYIRKVRENFVAFLNSSNKQENRQLYLYSAHDISIAGIISALNLNNMNVPKFCSTIIIELLLDNDQYYVKVLYYLDEQTGFQELKIPKCEVLCPLYQFYMLTEEVTPTDKEMTCD